MSGFLKNIKKVLPMLKTRLFAVVLLAVCCASTISAAAVSTNTVQLNDNGEIRILLTMREDLDSILEQAEITLSKDDEVVFSGFEDGFAQLDISRAFEVKIRQKNETTNVMVAKGTVEDALVKAGLEVDEYDYVSYSLNDALVPDMEIVFKDIEYEYTTERKAIEYKLKTEYSDEVESGSEKIVKGKEGIKELVLRSRIEDGKVVDTAQISETVIQKPVNGKKLIGTKAAAPASGAGQVSYPTGEAAKAVTDSSAVQTVSTLQPDAPVELDANGCPINYSKLITGKASAYSANPGAYTASGRPAQVGHVAVNPNQIPYGTKLYIRTTDGSMIYGYAVAADTGGFATQGRITVDLFFSTNAECLSFGVKEVEIFVLN